MAADSREIDKKFSFSSAENLLAELDNLGDILGDQALSPLRTDASEDASKELGDGSEVIFLDNENRPLEFLSPGSSQHLLPVAAIKASTACLTHLGNIESLDRVDLSDCKAICVMPGDQVARFQSQAGLDAQSPKIKLSASRHFEQREDGGIYALRYGYLQLNNHLLSLASPLWINGERLKVYWLVLEQRAASCEPDWLEFWWQEHKIKKALETQHGVSQIELLKKEDVLAEPILLYQGRPAVDGSDGRIDLFIDVEKRVGQHNPDGTINFHEKNQTANVTAGQRLATLKKPILAVHGENVFGDMIPAQEGKNLSVKCGENVRSEVSEDSEHFYAIRDGAVRFSNNVLSVSPILYLNDGVNFETGNIDFKGSVFIKGEIMPGFTVQAEGDIIVSGSVDNNVLIKANNDVLISHGVRGPKTTVKAGRDIQVQFAQGTILAAARDVKIGSFAYHSIIRAGDSCIVSRSSELRGGSIIGGEVRAHNTIDSFFAGTPFEETTELGVGLTFQQAELIEQLQADIENNNRHVRQLLNFFGLDRIDPDEIKKKIDQAANETQKKGLILRARQLGLQAKNFQTLLKKREEFLASIEPPSDESCINIREKIYPGVLVRIGNRKIKILDEKNSFKMKYADIS